MNGLIERLRLVYWLIDDVLHALHVAVGRMLGYVVGEVPPKSIMRITSARSATGFRESGLRTAVPIETACRTAGFNFPPGAVILDFGCGCGRQLMHLLEGHPGCCFHACDVSPKAVDYIRKTYPAVKAVCNSFEPPVPFPGDSFDLIYTVSTFSHFSEEYCMKWARELHRLLKPGGLAALTIEGPSVLDRELSDLASGEAVRRLESAGIYYKEYGNLKTAKRAGNLFGMEMYPGIAESYGNTILTDRFIIQNFVPIGYLIVVLLERAIDNRQDLLLLRKV